MSPFSRKKVYGGENGSSNLLPKRLIHTSMSGAKGSLTTYNSRKPLESVPSGILMSQAFA